MNANVKQLVGVTNVCPVHLVCDRPPILQNYFVFKEQCLDPQRVQIASTLMSVPPKTNVREINHVKTSTDHISV